MDVQIEQRGRQFLFVAEQPGERGGDGRCAGAATRAHDCGGDVTLGGLCIDGLRSVEHSLRVVERVAHLCGRERF